MTTNHHITTTHDLAHARAMLGRDDFVDAPGPTIHLHGNVANALLRARGWEINERVAPPMPRAWGGTGDNRVFHEYVAPDGERYWQRDEALTVALTAEGLDDDRSDWS